MSSTKATAPQKEVHEVFFLDGPKAMVEFYSASSSYLTVSGQPYGSVGSGKFAYWGNDNQMPERITKLVYGNDLKPQLIKKRVNFNCGRGIILYKTQIDAEGKRKKVPVSDPVIEEWLKRNQYNKVMRAIDKDSETYANAWLEFVFNNGKQIHSIKKMDATNVRCELLDTVTGRVNNFYISPDWKYAKSDRIIEVPNFDPEYPTYHKKCIIHLREEQSGQPYYGIPNWIGSEDATDVANTIWKFHKSGLKNGYALRYHIKIPESYFNKYTDATAKEKAMAALRESMNNWLSGADNVGKAFVSFIQQLNGVNLEEWKIETISPDLKDTAFNALFEQTTISNSRSHGIHPILGGVQMKGSLGSGTEIRSLYHAHIALETNEPRERNTDPLRIVQKTNGWDPEVEFGIEDIEFTTLDENPTGKQNAIK
jgi:hypothetical protein